MPPHSDLAAARPKSAESVEREVVAPVSYRNPVWPGYLGDPFVLRHEGTYYAYGTGQTALEDDGRAFPVLRSDDLVDWKYLGGAVRPIVGATAYWAPEVAAKDGSFFLYYSAAFNGGDESHGVRVAVADFPTGPFTDLERLLLPDNGFTIDPHPFRDPRTGRWYLFFATDYTADEPHGTGLAVAPLADDLITVTAPPVTVVRASAEWHVYEYDRHYKGQRWHRWHTIEGPFVLFHEGRYWCLYSGGKWSSENYGVGFAVADDPLGPWTDDMAAHGPVVLKGKPGQLIGPGHNSVTLTRDDALEVMVYHAWDPDRTRRRMCIDPLRWTPQGPRCDGPSSDARLLK